MHHIGIFRHSNQHIIEHDIRDTEQLQRHQPEPNIRLIEISVGHETTI